MKLILNIVLFILLNRFCLAQQFEYNNSIGKFKDATSFYINSTGILFVTDDITDEIYQLDTLGNLMESIGGYGWDESAFDDPVDVFADPLKVLVADKNNNRVQRFDKNLNFIFQIYTRDNENESERFGYPVSAVTSNLGDVFILDSENKRILKFDPFGKFIQAIGGYDYGSFTLTNPEKLAISMENNIFVVDNGYVFVYDNYGTGLDRFKVDEEINGIRIIFNWLTLNSKEKIFFTDLRSKEKIINEVILTGKYDDFTIVSSLIFNGKLYILTQYSILIFTPI